MKQLKKLKVFWTDGHAYKYGHHGGSCSDDDTGGRALSYGKVTGVVTDDLSSPLEGVTVFSRWFRYNGCTGRSSDHDKFAGCIYTRKYFNRYTYNYIYESRLPDGKCYRCGRKIQ